MFKPFYFSSIRKYVTLFGTLFNNIHISRTDPTDSSPAVFEKVPITYGPRDKLLARVIEDPTIGRTSSITLPIMSFEMTTVSYDGSRKLPTTLRIPAANTSASGSLDYQYGPVPYNIGFRLYVYAKNVEDASKIVEQIFPYFTPDWTSTIHFIPEMDYKLDIPIVLSNISIEDTYDGSFKDRRAIIWTLDFVLKGYFIGPIKTKNIIRFTNTEFYVSYSENISDDIGDLDTVSYVQVRPGLDANGDPTSNASISVPANTIMATDNFGYITTITEP